MVFTVTAWGRWGKGGSTCLLGAYLLRAGEGADRHRLEGMEPGSPDSLLAPAGLWPDPPMGRLHSVS